jgi:hypothetical protein
MSARRGLSAREAGSKSSSIELHNWSIFELRQELKKRGVLDDYQGPPINYEILLQKLTTLLEEERNEEEKQRLEKVDSELQAKCHDSDRVHRKQEAIERSRLRQLNEGYFKAKKAANEIGNQKEEENAHNGSLNDNDVDKNSCESVDPFKHKYRPRIGGRSV